MKQANYKNYNRFRPHLVHLSEFPGPKVGDKLVDVDLIDLEGNKVQLSSFLGKPIVLEMGSYTCPMYCMGVDKMTELAKQNPDVHFLVLYIREAHPGEKTSGHANLDQKMKLAKLIAKDEPIRKVLVDDVDGIAHKAYGMLPNSVHVFDEKGILTYRSDWSHPETVAKVLGSMKEKEVRFGIDHFEKIPPLFSSLKILLRGGYWSIFDVFAQAPMMFYEHLKARLVIGNSRTLGKKSYKNCC